jgi:hypothetical protein
MGASFLNANSRIAFYESATGTTARAVGIANPTGAVYGVAIWANTGGVVPSETNMHMFVQDGGSVGIGTSAPGNLLHIEGSAAADFIVRIRNTAASGVSAVTYYNNANAWQGYFGFDNAADSWKWFSISASAPLVMLTNNVERVRVAADGVIQLFLGGSMKTLSVDGSGFVKAA